MSEARKSVCYCTSARRGAGILYGFYTAELRAAGVTVAQYRLLTNLERLGAANITRWSEELGLDRTTMVRDIAPLAKRGLVERAGGRGKVFRLSSKGKEVVLRARPLWQAAQRKVESLLGSDDAEALLRIGEKIGKLRKDGD